jgi:hypothetical protein
VGNPKESTDKFLELIGSSAKSLNKTCQQNLKILEK